MDKNWWQGFFTGVSVGAMAMFFGLLIAGLYMGF